MSVINPGNNLTFKSTDALFGRIRKRLRSFNAAGLLDEGDWYWYIKDVVDSLGVATYEEKVAITVVKDFKALLPEDFSYLYAAYKCTPNSGESKQTVFPQTGFVFYIEDSYEPYVKCGTNCQSTKISYLEGEKFTTRTVIEGTPNLLSYDSPTLLQLSGNAKPFCDSKCKNLFARCAHEITIDKKHIYTNFREDHILMKYYGMAIDKESGLPMIPDNNYIEKAIEDYIVYRVFEDFHLNGEVPNLEGRYRDVKLLSEDSFKAASYWAKHPTFQNVVNKIRVDRKNLGIYQQIDW